MKENGVFYSLIDVAKSVEDPEGSVAACLVKNGDIVTISPSAENGIRHAEDLVLEMAREGGVEIDADTMLFTTLEPCSYRSPRNRVEDCTSLIISSGVKRVLFAAPDPNFSKDARDRLNEAGIVVEQISDEEIIEAAKDVFNGSITKTITVFGTDRKI
jgi:pyrimidine deaminase RibD-like protein